jgi:DNA-binding CsgD family transcriptional regulator
VKLPQDSDGSPVPGLPDFLDRLDDRLAKRNARMSRKLLAWGELLDAAGWCVALRLAGGECWLGERAKRALALPAVPMQWEELLARLEAVSPAEFQVTGAEARVWSAGAEISQPVSAVCLTRREREVLGWLRQGKTGPEIAVILGCAVRTVEKHVANLYAKFGVHGRAALILANLIEKL